jgi:hypothetical protein
MVPTGRKVRLPGYYEDSARPAEAS